nr:MAG TPA: hypothetical protein [Caudoviricetes sp.]
MHLREGTYLQVCTASHFSPHAVYKRFSVRCSVCPLKCVVINFKTIIVICRLKS